MKTKILKRIKIPLVILGTFFFVGCSYTQSALEYSKEGTERVKEGYSTKTAMTKEIVSYLKEANKDCGTNMRVENGVPVVNVKQCVDLEDALRVVEKVQIVQPQKVADIAEGVGNFFIKATNLAVPLASLYYQNDVTKYQTEMAYKTKVNDNQTQTEYWNNFTNTYQKTNEVQVIQPEIVTNTTESIRVVEPTVVQPQVITNNTPSEVSEVNEGTNE